MVFKHLLLSFFFTLCLVCSAIGQSTPIGVWKTIDDNTGEAKSHIEIYETEDGKFQGKIIKLLQVAEDTTCEACPDDKKDQPLLEMVIVWNLKAHKDYWSYGMIMDPENGKIYKCSVWLEDNNTLKVRGYIGFSALGRSQKWYRVE